MVASAINGEKINNGNQKAHNSFCQPIIPIAPERNPKEIDPTSPIKIFANEKLNNKKLKQHVIIIPFFKAKL